jgi:4'-phosphopantetheinyl transferase
MDKFVENWKTPPSSAQLSPDEIHLWCVDLESIAIANSPKEAPLSDDEIGRAGRFHFERDRKRFAETRIALRKILSVYIPLKAHEIEFNYQQNGKPEISESQNCNCIRFNVSHSGNFAIIGVTLKRGIGVDIERYRKMEFLEIARRYFSEREYGELQAIPAQDLQRHFFSCWTRKEALLKGLGVGIAHLLDQVSVTATGPAEITCFSGNPDVSQQWCLMDVNMDPDYAAAIAFEGKVVQVCQWLFHPQGVERLSDRADAMGGAQVSADDETLFSDSVRVGAKILKAKRNA